MSVYDVDSHKFVQALMHKYCAGVCTGWRSIDPQALMQSRLKLGHYRHHPLLDQSEASTMSVATSSSSQSLRFSTLPSEKSIKVCLRHRMHWVRG